MQGNGANDPTSSKPDTSASRIENIPSSPRLNAMVEAARQAGDVLMSGFRQKDALRLEHKGPVDLVTAFDRAAEKVLLEALSKHFPHARLVAEESTEHLDVSRSREPVIYIDPLDGTTNFAHGHPFFAVSIGWVEDNCVQCGVVFAPALGILYRADTALGASRNDVPCTVSQTDRLGESLLATGFPYDRRTSNDDNLAAFAALEKWVHGVRRCGSAALDLCFVADGTYDGYWEKKLKPWDIAAGIAMVTAAGGNVTTMDLQFPASKAFDRLNGALIASNGRIHAAIAEAVSTAEKARP